MGVLNENIRLGASAAGAYEIERSLRFNSGDTTKLERTIQSGGSTTTWTLSVWIKKTSFGATKPICGYYSADTNSQHPIRFNSSDQLEWYNYSSGYQGRLVTNRLFRDPNAWYHLVFVWDTTNGTAGDRMKIYVNGVEETSFATDSNPSSSQASHWNGNVLHAIGTTSNYNDGWFDGYMSEFHFVDNAVKAASDFGETDAITGQWIPIKYAGSYGTTGFKLDFSDNSNTTSSTLGADGAGSNDWTPTNFSVAAGTGNDSLEDTPLNNFPTLSPINRSTNNTFAEGNLLAKGGDNYAAATFLLPSSGKWYAEFSKFGDGATQAVAITRAHQSTAYNGHLGLADMVQYVSNGEIGNRARETGSATAWSSDADALIGVAVDMDNGAVYFAHDNTWQTSGDPTSGASKTGAIATDLLTDNNGEHLFSIQGYNGSTSYGMYANFGQRPFTYTPPTGYQKLCSENLPEPAIIESDKHFDTKLYTGTGSSNTLTGLEFSPGITLIKKRNVAENWEIQDSVRGATKRLLWNTDDDEATVTGSISAFTSDGFTVVDESTTNTNTHTYASFNWKAGSSAANTAGTINSTVSANTSAGISIVTFTGNGTAGATVGHGLGVAPEAVWIKSRSLDNYSWCMGHHNRGWTHFYRMSGGASGTGGATDEIGIFNDTAPSSTVVTLGNNGKANANTETYVAYCFSSVAGFSKVGSYVGNGAADGQMVHTGFTPKWIYFTGGGHRLIKYKDNIQQIGNPIGFNFLGSYNNAAEDVAGWDMDMLSNGFKLRGTDTSSNESGTTHYYIAFAESPFKYNRAQ